MLKNEIVKVIKLKEICTQPTTKMLFDTSAAATDTATAERLQPHAITATRGCDKNNNNSNNYNNQFSRTPTPNITTTTATSAAPTSSTAKTFKRVETIRYHSNTLTAYPTILSLRQLLLIPIFLMLSIDSLSPALLVSANVDFYSSTTPLSDVLNTTAESSQTAENATADFWQSATLNSLSGSGQNQTTNSSSTQQFKSTKSSFFAKFAKRLSTGNELWDGIITDCYQQPTISCFQKNVFTYLNDALDANDVNVTQRLKFFRNQVDFDRPTTEATASKDADDDDDDDDDDGDDTESGEYDYEKHERGNEAKESSMDGANEHLLQNEIPHAGRAAAETPIEEVTNALYGKSVKFAMTHDVEMQLPEMLFDGATFRISPRSMEGNGIIAKLELIPKQAVEARLAGKILKKIQKFLKSKLLLSFLALVLIIKIIKIKLFWLLPIVIGVGAAKKLLLKFLLFLFPALSHLFKLCSYYQQTYHSTKYHHHHHLINHHHTIVPPIWHGDHHSGPEIIYTNPPKGHPSTYLHGAPIHETYGPPSTHEHYDGGWENSGPGLGSEYISDINRVAQIDDNANYFKPHSNDANELSTWGLGTTQPNIQQQQQQNRIPATQQQRPPTLQQQPQQHHSSHHFNPFVNSDKQSIFGPKFKLNAQQQQQQGSRPSPVYTPPRNAGKQGAGAPNVGGLNAAQIAAQYNPQQQQQIQQPQQQQQSPIISAQLQEAIRIQAEQRIVAQQQKILENQPFVQDGQPIMPKNYDPFYSPILLKIDKILEQLGIKDDLCKERLVCSMYKDPNRYSPHSNFVSAELSRDTSELQTVTTTNQAVNRFYRLIQAARDGQDQRDCLSLYSQCNINTE